MLALTQGIGRSAFTEALNAALRGVSRRAGVPRRLPRGVGEARIRKSSVLAADISRGNQHRRRDLALNFQEILLRVTVFVIRVVAEGVGGIPGIGRRQRSRKPADSAVE